MFRVSDSKRLSLIVTRGASDPTTFPEDVEQDSPDVPADSVPLSPRAAEIEMQQADSKAFPGPVAVGEPSPFSRVDAEPAALPFRTHALAEEADLMATIVEDSDVFVSLPRDRQSYPVCLVAMTRLNGELSYLPDERFVTEDMLRVAVASPGTQNVLFLYEVPENRRHLVDRRMCLSAVVQNGSNLSAVRDFFPQYMDEEMCLAACSSKVWAEEDENQNREFVITAVPRKFRTSAVCKAAVDQDCGSLACIAADRPDYHELCLRAASSDSQWLKFFGAKYVDLSLCMAALSAPNWRKCIGSIPRSLLPRVARLIDDARDSERSARPAKVLYVPGNDYEKLAPARYLDHLDRNTLDEIAQAIGKPLPEDDLRGEYRQQRESFWRTRSE